MTRLVACGLLLLVLGTTAGCGGGEAARTRPSSTPSSSEGSPLPTSNARPTNPCRVLTDRQVGIVLDDPEVEGARVGERSSATQTCSWSGFAPDTPTLTLQTITTQTALQMLGRLLEVGSPDMVPASADVRGADAATALVTYDGILNTETVLATADGVTHVAVVGDDDTDRGIRLGSRVLELLVARE